MPKHYIYPSADPGGPAPDSRLELSWQRDQYCRLATTHWTGNGDPDTAITYLAEQAPRTEVNEDALAWPGQWVDLNRDQINHLIRQLRTIRDQVFGKDE